MPTYIVKLLKIKDKNDILYNLNDCGLLIRCQYQPEDSEKAFEVLKGEENKVILEFYIQEEYAPKIKVK